MNSKDQLLLEEAYELVQLNEGVIPSFITNKLKEVVSALVQKAFEEDPEETNKLIEAVKNKDVDSLKSMFVKHNTERMVKQHLDLPTASPVHEEGLWSGVKTTWNIFANFLADVGDMIYGKTGNAKLGNYIALILTIILAFAQLYALIAGGPGVLAGLSLLEILTTTKVGFLTAACYAIVPFLVTKDIRDSIKSNRSYGPNQYKRFGEKR